MCVGMSRLPATLFPLLALLAASLHGAGLAAPLTAPLCDAPVPAVVPCQEDGIVWWRETMGAAWAEAPARSTLSHDGTALYTAATVTGTDDGGSGCLVSAADTTTGMPLWQRVVPPQLGCGLALDLDVENSSGDLLLAAWDWPGRGGVHRIDRTNGLLRWSHTAPNTAFSTIVGDPAHGRLFAAGWHEGSHLPHSPFVRILDLETGAYVADLDATPADWDMFFMLDGVYEAESDRVIVSGTVLRLDESLPGGYSIKATVYAMNADGTPVWTAHDPAHGNSWGSALAYAPQEDRVFLAGQNGLLTFKAQTGTLVDLAPLRDGETWDDVTSLYGVAYDPAADIAVMTASRRGGANAAYSAVAARGDDGSLLWDRDVGATDRYAIPAPPVFDSSGALWVTGTLRDNMNGQISHRAVLARLDAENGAVTGFHSLVRLDGSETLAHYVAPLTGGDVVVASTAVQGMLHYSFEARLVTG
jgi:hypothetical protein